MTLSEKVAKMLESSLIQSGMSVSEVAEKMKVGKKSIYRWMSGETCPTLIQTIEWFHVLHVRMIPSLMKLFYMTGEKDLQTRRLTEPEIERELIFYMKSLTPHQKEQLHYIFCSDHGSAPDGILQMTVANLQTPLRHRLGVAATIALNYEIAASRDELTDKDDVQPDIDILKKSIEKGREAIIQGKDKYTHYGEDKEDEA